MITSTLMIGDMLKTSYTSDRIEFYGFNQKTGRPYELLFTVAPKVILWCGYSYWNVDVGRLE